MKRAIKIVIDILMLATCVFFVVMDLFSGNWHAAIGWFGAIVFYGNYRQKEYELQNARKKIVDLYDENDDIPSRLLLLDRWTLYHNGPEKTWTAGELGGEEEGEWVKWQDIEEILINNNI